jgi:hypothetical protein
LFFKKNWPQRELDGLAAREDSEGRKVILPVWHNINRDYVLNYSPTLADRLASKTADGLEVVLKELLEVITEDREPGKREVNSNKASERDQTSDFTLNDTAWIVLNAAQGSFADAMSTEEIIRTTGLDRTLVFQTCVILRDTRYLVFTDEFKDMAMVKITGLGLQTIKAADKFRSKPGKTKRSQTAAIPTEPYIPPYVEPPRLTPNEQVQRAQDWVEQMVNKRKASSTSVPLTLSHWSSRLNDGDTVDQVLGTVGDQYGELHRYDVRITKDGKIQLDGSTVS